MKNLKSLLMSLLAVAVLALTACTGPEGPAGKDGTNGTSGKDGAAGTAGCITCHGNDDVDMKINQYEMSMHGEGAVWLEEAGRAQCGACHQGAGFAEAVALGTLDPVSSISSPIDCKTCHTIHTKYDKTDLALRLTSAVQLRQNPANATEKIDFKGSGNTCARCHQARPITRTGSATHDSLTGSLDAYSGKYYNRVGPHYGIIANVVTWKGMEDTWAGLTATANVHASVSCVTCHMGLDTANLANGGHTFKMTEAGLANMIENMNKAGKNTGCACHQDVTALRAGTLTKAIAADLTAIKAKLVSRGYLFVPTDPASTASQLVIGQYVATPSAKKIGMPKDTTSMIIDYLYMSKDRSNGVHNPGMMKSMVAKLKVAAGL